MTMHRRAFLLATAIVTAAPVFAKLPTLSSTGQSRGSQGAEPMKPDSREAGTSMETVVFKIDGWDLRKDTGTYRSRTSLADRVTSNEVLIRVNQTWRTAWR
jgi:hypothetical protein